MERREEPMIDPTIAIAAWVAVMAWAWEAFTDAAAWAWYQVS